MDVRWAGSLLSHHVVSLVMGLLTLVFVRAVLRQPRPTGSALAWLLVIVLVPYVGMPLYLMLGGRKFQRARRAKAPLRVPPVSKGNDGGSDATSVAGPFGLRELGIETSADKVEWLADGVQAFDCFFEQINTARKSIRIVTFVIGSDPTGTELLEALAKRAQDGVRVHLLIDDLLLARAPRAQLSKLRAAGGEVERFMPLLHLPFRGQSNLRNHRKIAIFDGERAIVGGMNLADEYMGPAPRPDRWRDLALLLTGDAAPVLDSIFRADWEFASGAALPAAVRDAGSGKKEITPIRVVPSGPDAPTDPLYDALMTGIFRAERRVWLATPYFIPDEPLVKALLLAVRRGVDVRIVVPAVSNHLLADLAAAPPLRQLGDEGATVHRLEGMLHAKAFLVDDAQAVVGSANFDMRSLFLDYEVALFLSGAHEIERLGRWFAETMRSASAAAPESGWFRSRAEGIARLLAPLL